jgi:flagellin-like protein
MTITRKNDEAVSPVIGVILMVAITVILAAVIAAFVFGMSGNISKTKTVALTVQKESGAAITVMNNGGQDAALLTGLTITADPPAAAVCSVTDTTNLAVNATNSPCIVTLNAGTALSIPVGDYVKLNAGSTTLWNTKTKITVVGTFNDGSNQVLLDTYV